MIQNTIAVGNKHYAIAMKNNVYEYIAAARKLNKTIINNATLLKLIKWN